MTRTDIMVLTALLLAAVLLLVARPPALGGDGRLVQVELGGRVVRRLPLAPHAGSRRISVELPRGRAVVVLADGGARILPMPRSICPRGICAHQGLIRREGETLVCAPNRLVVRIVGDTAPRPVDAVAR